MKRFRKNKKGFSLVELIIVIAIMVALVVVMAPAYVKYVQRSHDAVVEAAAESVLQFVKTELADGSLTGSGTITVEGKDSGDGHRYIDVDKGDSQFRYKPDGVTLGENEDGWDYFVDNCGADTKKTIKSNLKYTIIVNDMSVEGHPEKQVEFESETNAGG